METTEKQSLLDSPTSSANDGEATTGEHTNSDRAFGFTNMTTEIKNARKEPDGVMRYLQASNEQQHQIGGISKVLCTDRGNLATFSGLNSPITGSDCTDFRAQPPIGHPGDSVEMSVTEDDSVSYDSGACEYRDLQQALDKVEPVWVPVVLVNSEGVVRTRRYPSKRYRREGEYLVLEPKAKQASMMERCFPFETQVAKTNAPKVPRPPPRELQGLVSSTLPHWDACVSLNARARLERAVEKASKDEKFLLAEGALQTHRIRAMLGETSSEVRIGPEEYHPTVRKVLEAGFTLRVSPSGIPSIREPLPLQLERWGFHAHRLWEDAMKIAWPDQELCFFLQWGFWDFSGSTPPVCSFSPHQRKALVSSAAFHEVVHKDIDAGWIANPQSFPTSIPFRTNPGSIEDKKDGSNRLVWNASWPIPGSFGSFVTINQGICLPLSTNANTTIPEDVLREWTAIESNNEMISIMASGAWYAGMRLLGRTYDLRKWFRQLAVAEVELWKCGVHVLGGFREDTRMQMGRTSSAHSAQRVSLLLTHMVQQAAQSEKWGLRSDGSSKQQKLQEWVIHRKRFGGDWQSRTVTLSVYQDDITVIAIGEQAAADAEQGIPRICEGRYEVELSRKEEANRPFSTSFGSIGASYDLEDLENIVCRPTDVTQEKYRVWAEKLKSHSGKLVQFEELERFVGLHQFVARFIEDGQLLCNAAYACLKAGYELSTSKKQAPYSREFCQDVSRVLNKLHNYDLPAISRDPLYMHPGLMGASSDASGGSSNDGRGWGVCMMGALSAGEWSTATQEAIRDGAISISPLELLGSAIALDIGYKAGHLGGIRALVLRNDNESACGAVNSGRAASGTMREALKVFTKVRHRLGLRVRLQHIKGEHNQIADYLSRGRRQEARKIAAETWRPEWFQPPREWEG